MSDRPISTGPPLAALADELAAARRRSLAFTLVVLLTIAYVAPYAYAALATDTVRDLLASRSIALGEHFPAVGPSINFSFHLGPAWLYLQAIPLLFSSTTLAATLFVGVLAGAKFALAYACGARIGTPRLGLCFAAALALPTVGVFQWLLSMHPCLVESTLLLALYCALRGFQANDPRWLYAAALALGLAVQFHPTSLYYVPLLIAWMLARDRAPVSMRALHALAALAIASVWFWPALASDVIAMPREFSVGAARLGQAAGHASNADVLTVARTFFGTLPYAIGGSYFSTSGVPSLAWLAVLATIASSVVIGLALIAARRQRAVYAPVLGALALFAGGFVIASTIRSYVSFYTMYFLLPLGALVAAASLDTLLGARARAAKLIGVAGVSAIVVVHGVASWRAIEHGRDAFIRSAVPALGDLRHADWKIITAGVLPAASRDALGRFLCERGDGVTLHGDLAYQVGASFSLDTLLACGAPLRPTIIGRQPPDRDAHLYGLSRGLLAALGRTPERWVASIGIGHPIAIDNPDRGRRAEADFYYFDETHDKRAYAPLVREFDAPPTATIALYNLKPFDSRWTLKSVRADGVPVAAAVETFDASFFVAPPASAARAAIRWSVEIDTDVPQWTDIFAF